MSADTLQIPVVVLVRDLMFASKIRSAAKSLNVPVQMLRDAAQLATIEGGTRLIVDLNQGGFLEAAREWKDRTGGAVVGFVSHVDTPTIEAAREAGLEVLPRSRFVERLPELLR